MPTKKRKSKKKQVKKTKVIKKSPKKITKRVAKKPIKKKSKQAKQSKKKLFLKIFLGLTLLFLLSITSIFVWYAQDLPSVDRLMSATQKRSILLQTQQNELITTYGQVYGEYIPAHRLPRSAVDALIATEDRRFYYHFGFDIIGVTRAMYANYKAERFIQGGSTLTQQLAKNVFLTPERSMKRKIQELMLSFWLEYKFTKNEILSLYLNRVYFGSGSYGIDAGAKKYFGKSATDLSLKESAMLIGLLKAPSRYSPANSRELAEKRTNQVLMNMIKTEKISPERAEIARRTPFKFVGVSGNINSSRYFADWIVDDIPNFVGHISDNIVVTTSLDPKLQTTATTSLKTVLDVYGEEYAVDQGAIIVMTPSGEVKAMVGGKNYQQSQFNRATQALRQPGSAFKLFVYLAGIYAGYTPYSQLLDSPINVQGWQPKNYNDKYIGKVSLTEAFAKSINTVAVAVSETVGRKKVISMAKKLGITTYINPHPSVALGTSELYLSELTGAYATLANRGILAKISGIVKIEDTNGNVLYNRAKNIEKTRVLRPNVVNMMNNLLIAVIEEGTGKGAYIKGVSSAGKTGTSQDYRDAWFIGYTKDLVVGVWVGNDDGSPTNKVTGGNLPVKIWKSFIQEVTNPTDETLPTGIEYDKNEELPWLKEKKKESFWDKVLDK